MAWLTDHRLHLGQTIKGYPDLLKGKTPVLQKSLLLGHGGRTAIRHGAVFSGDEINQAIQPKAGMGVQVAMQQDVFNTPFAKLHANTSWSLASVDPGTNKRLAKPFVA